MALRKNKKDLGFGIEAQDLNLSPIQKKHVTPLAAPTQDITTPAEPKLEAPTPFDYTAPDALRKAAEYATRMGDVDAARELVSGKYTGFDANGNLLGKDITKGQKRRLNAARFFGVNTGLTSQQDNYIAAQNAALKAGAGIYDEAKAKYDADIKKAEEAKAKAEADKKTRDAEVKSAAETPVEVKVEDVKVDVPEVSDPLEAWRKDLEVKAKGMGSHRGWLGQDGGDLNDENNWGWKDAEGNWLNDYIYNLIPTDDEDKQNGLYIKGRRFDMNATNPYKKNEDYDLYNEFNRQQARMKAAIDGRYNAYGDGNYGDLGKNAHFKAAFGDNPYLNISKSLGGLGNASQMYMVNENGTDKFYEYDGSELRPVNLRINNGLAIAGTTNYGQFVPLDDKERYTHYIPEGAQIKSMKQAAEAAAARSDNGMRSAYRRGVRFREGGRIDYDKIRRMQIGGQLRMATRADEAANAAAKNKELNRTAYTNEVLGAMGDTLGISDSPYQLSTRDKVKLGALGADVAGLIASFTGAGAPIGGLIGAAGTTANMIADWNNDELTTGQKWGNALLGYGLDAASAIPFVGTGAKAAKIGKVAKGLGRGVQVAMAGMGMTAGANALAKLASDEKMTIDDWRNLAAGIQGLMGGTHVYAGIRGSKAVNPKSTLKTNKGRTLEFADDAAAKNFATKRAAIDTEARKIMSERPAQTGEKLTGDKLAAYEAKQARLAELNKQRKALDNANGGAFKAGETIQTTTTGKSWQLPWAKNDQGKREMRWVRSSGEQTPVIGHTNSGRQLMTRAEAEGMAWDRRASAWWNERMGFVKPGQANTAKPTAEPTKKTVDDGGGGGDTKDKARKLKVKQLKKLRDSRDIDGSRRSNLKAEEGGSGGSGNEGAGTTPPPGGNGGNGGSNGGGEKPTPKALPQPKGVKALPQPKDAKALPQSKGVKALPSKTEAGGSGNEGARTGIKGKPMTADDINAMRTKERQEVIKELIAKDEGMHKAPREATSSESKARSAVEKASSIELPSDVKPRNLAINEAKRKALPKKAEALSIAEARKIAKETKNKVHMSNSEYKKIRQGVKRKRNELKTKYPKLSEASAKKSVINYINKKRISSGRKPLTRDEQDLYVLMMSYKQGGIIKASDGTTMPNLTSASTKSNKLPSLSGIATPENLRLATSFVGNKKLMDKVKDLPRPSGTDPIHYDRMSNYGVSSIMPQISAINQSANAQKPMYTDAKLNAMVNLATNANANEARNSAYNSLAATNREVDAKNIELGNSERLANLQRAAANRKEQETYNNMINTNEQALIRSNFASLDNALLGKAQESKLAKQTIDQIDYSEAARREQNIYQDNIYNELARIDKLAADAGMDRASYLMAHPAEQLAFNRFKREAENAMMTKLGDERKKMLPSYSSGGRMTLGEKKELAAHNANIKAQQQAIKDYNTLMRDKAKENQRMLELMQKRLGK